MSTLRKTYLYKLYRADGTYLTSFYSNGFDVVTRPQYNWKISGGKGNISLEFAAQIQKYIKNIIGSNFPFVVKIYMHDKESLATGQLIYTGSLIDNNFTLTPEGFIKPDNFLYISGEKDLENKVVENPSTGATKISYVSMDISNIIKDLLDKYQLKGGLVTYTNTTIPTVGLILSITVKNETYLGAIRRVCGYLPPQWCFFIDGENKFNLKFSDLETADHIVTIGKEVVEGSFRYTFGEMVNSVFFHGGEITPGNKFYKKFTNALSQSQYGLYETIVSDERVTATTTVEAKTNQILQKKGTPVRLLEAVILDSNGNEFGYDIDSIKPGDTIQLVSTDVETVLTTWVDDTGTIGNMVWDESAWDLSVNGVLGIPFQIQEIKYDHDRATIIASDFIEDLATTINQLDKRQQELETINSPDIPS